MKYINGNINKINLLGSGLSILIISLIKILWIFRIIGHLWDPKGEDHSYLPTLRDINAPKSGPFKYGNNAKKLPKQIQNNFEKGQKMTFLNLEMAKITISGGQILTKNLNFWGHL